MNKFFLFYLVGSVALLSLVGSMDFQDQLQQQELYCEMVHNGAWGDYNGNYSEVCDGIRSTEGLKESLETK